MWDLIVSVPDHCLSFYFISNDFLYLCNVSTFSMTPCLSGLHIWPMMHHKTTATKYNVYLAT